MNPETDLTSGHIAELDFIKEFRRFERQHVGEELLQAGLVTMRHGNFIGPGTPKEKWETRPVLTSYGHVCRKLYPIPSTGALRASRIITSEFDGWGEELKQNILEENIRENARIIDTEACVGELLRIAKAYRNYLRTAAHTEGEVATFHHIESVIAKVEGTT